jgi:hypothetical protein
MIGLPFDRISCMLPVVVVHCNICATHRVEEFAISGANMCDTALGIACVGRTVDEAVLKAWLSLRDCLIGKPGPDGQCSIYFNRDFCSIVSLFLLAHAASSPSMSQRSHPPENSNYDLETATLAQEDAGAAPLMTTVASSSHRGYHPRLRYLPSKRGSGSGPAGGSQLLRRF